MTKRSRRHGPAPMTKIRLDNIILTKQNRNDTCRRLLIFVTMTTVAITLGQGYTQYKEYVDYHISMCFSVVRNTMYGTKALLTTGNWTYPALPTEEPWTFDEEAASSFREELEEECHIKRDISLTKSSAKVGKKIVYDVEPQHYVTLAGPMYVLLPETSPFDGKFYNTCAVVGNGGILRDSRCGDEIDTADFVFRCNLAPISRYHVDVGTRTNFTTMNPSVLKTYYNRVNSENSRKRFINRLEEIGDGFLWIPAFVSKMGEREVNLLNSILMGERLNGLPLQPLYPTKEVTRAIFKFWNTRKLEVPRLTTGLCMYTIAASVCRQVALYGFYPSNHDREGNRLPYHYYERRSRYNFEQGPHKMYNEYKALKSLHDKGVVRLRERCKPLPSYVYAMRNNPRYRDQSGR
ncbi:CMP-N-acetylneuraminate-poly-alpha-2,8-sialyltransferase-like isoform X1 [Branchiostoma floridae x Branchiostoma japonicum]